MMKSARIDLRVTPNQKTALELQAASLKMSLSDYLLSVLKQSEWLRCPKCNRYIVDVKIMPVVGEANIRCQCGYIFVHDFGIE